MQSPYRLGRRVLLPAALSLAVTFSAFACSTDDNFAPMVTSISPHIGPLAGGTSVTITGHSFSTAAGEETVNFGTVASPNVHCPSSTSCVAKSPPGTGTVDVVVRRVGHRSSEVEYTRVALWGPGASGQSVGTANGEMLDNPGGIAVDGAGNVYVTDTANNRVEKFDSNGTFLTAWGSPGTGPGQFDGPNGLAVDPGAHAVWVVDTGNNRVQRFDATGNYVSEWHGAASANLLNQPRAIALAPTGNLWVTDTGNNRIQGFFYLSGTYLGGWGTFGTGNGQFNQPRGIVVDAAGEVLVADTNNNRIQRFGPVGAFLGAFPTVAPASTNPGGFFKPDGLAVDQTGILYTAEAENGRIQKFTTAGVYLTLFPASKSFGIAVDGAGDVYGIQNLADGHVAKYHPSDKFRFTYSDTQTIGDSYGDTAVTQPTTTTVTRVVDTASTTTSSSTTPPVGPSSTSSSSSSTSSTASTTPKKR